MLTRLSRYAINSPKQLIFWLLALTFFTSIGFKNAWLATDFKISFEKDDPLLQAMIQQEETFSKTDWIVLVVSAKSGDLFTPERLSLIENITHQSWQTPFSLRVDSLSNFNHIQGTEDELIVAPFLEKSAGYSPTKIAEVKSDALSTPELLNNLLSKDGKTTLINIQFELPDNPVKEVPLITHFIHKLVAEQQAKYPNLTFHIAGSVENTQAFTDAMIDDMLTLVPAAYLVMVLFLLIMFRSLMATIITLTLVTFASTLTMGIKCWLDGSLNAINMIAPTIIMTIAVADCVHLLTSFLQHYRSGESKATAMHNAITHNLQPVLLTSLTTIVGFLCLNFHESPPLPRTR